MTMMDAKLLKRFGHIITKLSFGFNLSKFEDLCDFVVKHCKENITELRLDYRFDDGTQHLIKASEFFSKLASQFPKLERLSISRSGSELSKAINSWHVVPIPTMTHFKFSDSDEIDFQYDMIKSCLALNPQVRSLTLNMDQVPCDFMSFLHKNLQNLRCLKFKSAFFEGLKRKINVKANILTNLKTLKFKIDNSESISDFKFLSKSLEYLKVQVESDFIASKLVKIVSSFSVLKKLKLIVPNRLYYGNDCDVYDRNISMEGLKNIPANLKYLTKLVLKFENKDEMDEYIKELSVFGSWRGVVNNDKGCIAFNKA